MTDLQERVKTAIQKKIDDLKAAQLPHAVAIEKALKTYERNIRVRSVSDYIALAKHQRLILGLSESKSETEHSGSMTTTVVFKVREKSQ